MKNKLIIFIIIILINGFKVYAEDVNTVKDEIYYKGDCVFQVFAPTRWVLDKDHGLNNKIPFIMYPSGFSWDNTPVKIFAIVNASPGVTRDKMFKSITDNFKDKEPDASFSFIGGGKTREGFHYTSYQFVGQSKKHYDRLAFVEFSCGTACIAYTSGDLFFYNTYTEQFDEVINTFKYRADLVPKWEEFSSDEGRFSIMVPGVPAKSIHKVNTSVGIIDMNLYYLESNIMVYSVIFSDYPDNVIRFADIDKMLDNSRDGAIANFKGKLLNEKEIKLNGFPGREMDILSGDEERVIKYRFYLIRNRLYQIGIITIKQNADSEQIPRFMDSFKLVQGKLPETPAAVEAETE